MLGHDESGTTAESLRRELRPVALEARDSDEGEARLGAAGIVRHATNAPHTGRNLRPENLGKLCPVQDHSPSVTRAIAQSVPQDFSREHDTPKHSSKYR